MKEGVQEGLYVLVVSFVRGCLEEDARRCLDEDFAANWFLGLFLTVITEFMETDIAEEDKHSSHFLWLSQYMAVIHTD